MDKLIKILTEFSKEAEKKYTDNMRKWANGFMSHHDAMIAHAKKIMKQKNHTAV